MVPIPTELVKTNIRIFSLLYSPRPVPQQNPSQSHPLLPTPLLPVWYTPGSCLQGSSGGAPEACTLFSLPPAPKFTLHDVPTPPIRLYSRPSKGFPGKQPQPYSLSSPFFISSYCPDHRWLFYVSSVDFPQRERHERGRTCQSRTRLHSERSA